MIGDHQVRPASPGGPAAAPAPVARRHWLAVIAQVLKRHWLAAVLLSAGLVLRVLVQLAYRPALFYIDSVRYLQNAEGNDPVGYKGPLLAILSAGNVNAVAAVQHLLGLAMAILIYVLLLRRGAARWLAALAIAPILLDSYQLQAEQTIMPTAVFEALVIGGLAILLWQPVTSWRRVLAGGIVLGTSATVAQVGEALLLPAVIYLLVAGGGWRQALGKAAAMIVAFAVPIAAYSTVSLLVSGDFFLSHTGVTSYYGRMAAAADCATLRLPADERAMCPTTAQQARGPDWLEYAPHSPIRSYYLPTGPRGNADSLIADFNSRVLSQQPLRVLGAYGRDVVKLFELDRTTGLGDTPIARWQFQTRYPYFTSQTTKAIVIGTVRKYGGGTPTVWAPVARFLRAYQLDGGYTPGPLLALLVLTGLAGSLAVLRRRSDRQNPADPATRQPALACLLFFASAVFVLLISDTFEFSWRYQLPALVTLVPAGALGIAVVTAWIRKPGSGLS
jgi:hypothetical protein